MESKLPSTGTTIFAVMSALSEECNAINLSQGFPSFNPDQSLLDAVSRNLNDGANQYAPMTGIPALREAIGRKVLDLYGRRVDIQDLSLIHISEPTRRRDSSRMPSSA